MNYKILDVVVLQRDISPDGLCRGDVGAVVELYEPDDLEVELVLAPGRTTAVLTLNVRDVRHVEAHDMLSVRSVAWDGWVASSTQVTGGVHLWRGGARALPATCLEGSALRWFHQRKTHFRRVSEGALESRHRVWG